MTVPGPGQVFFLGKVDQSNRKKWWLICCILISGIATAQVVPPGSKDRNIVNVNPDPQGEAWNAGGITQEEWAASLATMPELGAAGLAGLGKLAARPLPDKVDNTVFASFRPIFNQKGGSCSQASAIGYVYTYEIDYVRGLPANVAANQYPYDFSYNFINSGSGTIGGLPENGWAIVRSLGVPNASVYGGFGLGKFNQWVTGYPIYYNAMTNRLDNYFTIKTGTPAGITQMKQWLFDHQAGTSQGGCLVMAYNASGEILATIPSGIPEAGKKIMYQFGNSGGHAVTVAGYNDSVRYDYNKDGRYTNSDPNDVRTWEIGAFLMVNSWGTSFGNSGKVWIPYRMLADPTGAWQSQLSGMKTQSSPAYSPLLTYKVSLKHKNRSLVRLRAGYANSATATAPTGTPKSFSKAFNYSGGAFPMQGISNEPIEIGLDVSDFMPNFTGSEVSLFLLVDSKGDSGSVLNFSLLDYTAGEVPLEIACSRTNVNLPIGTTTLKITKTLKPLLVLTPNGGEKLERGRTFTITWFDKIAENVRIDLLKNDQVVSTIAAAALSSGTFEWAVPADLVPGSDYKIKIGSVSNPATFDISDNAFSVVEKSTLEVASPNGGEFLEKGATVPIRWNSTVTGNLTLELYKDKMPDTVITTGVSGSGPYAWTVPATLQSGYTYTVRITSADNPLVFDESDGFLSIVNPILKGPYVQTFDAFPSKSTVLTGSWEQRADDDIDWTGYNGSTPSRTSSTGGGTGPIGDHTLSTGNYLYVEASGSNSPAKAASMLSPMVTTGGLADVVIGFWYHMFSAAAHMGDLYVDVFANGVWKDSVVHLAGNQGDEWHEQIIRVNQIFPELQGAVSRLQVRFSGITGSAYDSDICLDDFRVTGSATPVVVAGGVRAVKPGIKSAGNRIHYWNARGRLTVVTLNGMKVMEFPVSGSGAVYIGALPRGIYVAALNGQNVKIVR